MRRPRFCVLWLRRRRGAAFRVGFFLLLRFVFDDLLLAVFLNLAEDRGDGLARLGHDGLGGVVGDHSGDFGGQPLDFGRIVVASIKHLDDDDGGIAERPGRLGASDQGDQAHRRIVEHAIPVDRTGRQLRPSRPCVFQGAGFPFDGDSLGRADFGDKPPGQTLAANRVTGAT